MSLLLKALKQAEATKANKPDVDRPGPDERIDAHLELEPVIEPGTASAREWVEPPELLFGSSERPPKAPPGPGFRWPQLSLVPLAAVLAALVALGYGIYLYFALQPPTAMPVPTATAVAPVAPAVAPTQPALPPPAPAKPAAALASPGPQPVPAAAVALAPTRLKVPAARTVLASPRVESSAPPPATRPVFQPDIQSTALSQAFSAYQRGALAEAQRLYTQIAARGRNNIDALLGLAAIASAQKRDADAQRLYREVLDIDPLNATAQGALLDLLGNTDSQATESRLKMLIERDPSPHLYQTLGNLYAEQKRWNDAQAAYFEAFRGAPDNADYAFNLAVSLDQLRQPAAALKYYEKALAINGVHRFDNAQADTRIRQLKSVR